MTQIIKGNTADWEVVIGCEVHAQIATESKLFSRSATAFGAGQNSQTSFVDAAMPGMLPVLNENAVKQAIKTGLSLDAEINLHSIFDRKNYFYPDLPQGYQISQFSDPIVSGGKLKIELEEGGSKEIHLERIHIEQDAGKSVHDQHPQFSLIDLNRSGVALMEIVSKPDMRSGQEAADYIKKLRSLVRAIGTCDGDMEKGNLRCDANVSVRKVGTEEFGTRCEIKNLNSMRNIIRAVEFEANRQVEIIEEGGEINQETRLFDALTGETRAMRSKEDAMDYRYFPDPDLPALELTQEFVDEIKKSLPELPDAKKERYIADLKLSDYEATILSSDKDVADYFEEVIKGQDVKLAVNWISSELFGRLKKQNLEFTQNPISAKQMSGLLKLISDNVISGKIAKDVLDMMFESGKDAEIIVEEKGLKQVTDTGAVKEMVQKVLDDNPKQLEDYRGGNERLFGFFVGQVMKASQGKANPKMVNEILKELL